MTLQRYDVRQGTIRKMSNYVMRSQIMNIRLFLIFHLNTSDIDPYYTQKNQFSNIVI